jgi:uncharacterized membrane protein
MKEEVRQPTTRDHSRMQRAVGLMTVLFWASVVLVAVLMGLSWVAPVVRNAWSFNLLSSAVLVLVMVSSAFLFWQQRRADRQELRAVRRESRDIPVEGSEEWSPKAWLYITAFGLSFFLAWYLVPHLLLSF